MERSVTGVVAVGRTATARVAVAPTPFGIEAEIAGKTRGQMMHVMLSLLGPVAFVLAPMVYFRATQALQLIEEHEVGEEYRGQARALRSLAISVFLTQAALVAWVAFAVLTLVRFGG